MAEDDPEAIDEQPPTRPVEVTARFAASVDGLDLDASQRVAVAAIARDDRPSLYLHGPVGRGKSMLAERYLAAFGEDTRRLHLHELFRMLQAELARDWKAPAVMLRRMLGGIRVVLVDEFHVHDLADALYLSALLEVAAEDGITVIATSNYAPADLLPAPGLHDRFLPAIEHIAETFAVVDLGDGPDHRSAGDTARPRFASGAWHPSPPTSAATIELVLADIPVQVRRIDGAHVEADFAALCVAEVGVRQFQALADRFDALTLHAVPDLATVRREPLMRFTTLVDVLHDHDVRLVVHAAASFARLTDAADVPVDAARTLSRLGTQGRLASLQAASEDGNVDSTSMSRRSQ
ncbi:cell division protein ZapE [Microbacterium dauci]|uniref:Cell division protein ZapE n=1 Tax=Microbacterium dauci TaxID=3048008 RepID=A0ABT6ZEK9_9MICO|nr:cell division protein ZapE [Microbacterium sp. LX3-4]MDJ1114358.1 cell division protein ZapE [Microbacterium sp. LX3-4]